MCALTRIERKKAPVSKVVGFPERLALFVTALHKQQTDELFVCLAGPVEKRAFAFAAEMKQWDSARRQARLAHEFGVRPDATERLTRLVLSVDGVLRAAVVAALPATLRREFPQFQGAADSFPEAVRAVAARLVREASR